MNMKLKQIALYVALVLGLITPALAFAQNAAVSATTNAAGASASIKLTATDTKLQARGSAEIDRRIAALASLNARAQAMQKVTPAFKDSLSTALQNQSTALIALKAKINADTDTATLKTDLASVTDSYRIFALVLPQARIAAAADREVTLVSMMSTLGSKLQARIQAAGQGGATVTALTTALTDMATKLQDAQTQATNAVTISAALTADNGDKTIMASNTATLKTARGNIKTSQSDLVAARKDVDTIIKGLKAVEVSASASTTVQTSQ